MTLNMEHTYKEYCLEVWGDLACFTRPEFKVERVSYDVITPSAARAIFESIFWKEAIRWEITKIEVLNPIQWISIRRNEVGQLASERTEAIFIEDKRQQRNSLMLRDVRYRIHARQIFIPVRERKVVQRRGEPDDNPGKYNAMFVRRARSGQCFNQPYLGTRECSAFFRLVESEEHLSSAIDDTRDFGFMLYDMDFSNPNNIIPMFYRAKMNNGVIEVPKPDSEEVLK